MQDKKANASIGSMIGILLLAVMAAALMPTAISAIRNVNTTPWGGGEAALWVILPLLFVAAVAYGVYKKYFSGA